MDRQGVIASFSGNGQVGNAGDGGPAINANLNGPTGLALGFGGTVLIADSGNNRIRVVANNIITAFAGEPSGVAGYNDGDGGRKSAISALFDDPECLAVDAEGNLYVADMLNDRIRVIDPNLAIHTIAGNGTRGFSGDNAAATGS